MVKYQYLILTASGTPGTQRPSAGSGETGDIVILILNSHKLK